MRISKGHIFLYCTFLYVLFVVVNKAGGVQVVRPNIEADYGLVHIIESLMGPSSLIDSCPSLATVLSSEGQQQQQQHSISQRKVSDEDDEFYPFQRPESSINADEINSLFNINQEVASVLVSDDDFRAVSDHHSSNEEAKYS